MEEKQPKLGTFPFVIGGISFIPLLGVVFGIIAIIWGATTKKLGGRKLVVIGGCGIGFTVVLYGALFYFGTVQRGGIYDDLRGKLAKEQLSSLLQSIEIYNVQFGEYPSSLTKLRKKLSHPKILSITDATDTSFSTEKRHYHYELVGQTYHLLAVGLDGQPYTSDDILPEVNFEISEKLGYRTHQGSTP